MGGNAIKDAVRLDKQYYGYVSDGTSSVLKKVFPDAKVDVIPSYEEKDSFGDLDILISGVPTDKLAEFCHKVLNATEVVVNGNVVSFGLEIHIRDKKREIFQIDLITMPEDTYEFALKYFAFNDLGNLIGQTAHGIGLKFGHDGLWYKYIVDTQLVDEICITQNFDEALEFLGYDSKRYYEGFNTLQDIFEYATSSQHFTTWNYLLENRNAAGRIRDKKRKTYMLFLDWLKDKHFRAVRNPRDTGMALIMEHMKFPETVKAYAIATLGFHRVSRVKKKINGELIREWTGLVDKELGSFFADYRTSFGDEYWTRIDSMTSEQVETDIKECYKLWSKQ